MAVESVDDADEEDKDEVEGVEVEVGVVKMW